MPVWNDVCSHVRHSILRTTLKRFNRRGQKEEVYQAIAVEESEKQWTAAAFGWYEEEDGEGMRPLYQMATKYFNHF